MSKAYELYTDGSYRFRQHLAGYGGYIKGPNGNTLLTFSELITDSNMYDKHELFGIKRGLELAIEVGIKNLNCFTDYIMAVNILNINDPKELKKTNFTPLEQEIINLKEHFESINIEYIPRLKNKKADKLSKVAIDEFLTNNGDPTIFKSISPIPKMYFNSGILTEAKKNRKEVIAFNEELSKVENYLVFNKSESNTLEVYHVKKNDADIIVNLIEKVEMDNNNQNELLQVITKTLKNNIELKECVIFNLFDYFAANYIEDLFKGYSPITNSVIDTIKELEVVIPKFDKIYFKKVPAVVSAIYKDIEKRRSVKQFNATPENIVRAIEELGNEDYKIGQNPVIEQSLKRKRDQTDNVWLFELQKYYLGKFLGIGMRNFYKGLENETNEVKNIKREIKLEELRNGLKEQGIKFRV